MKEKGKIEAGGSDKRLKELEADREQHKAEVKTLTENIKAGRKLDVLDQEGIRGLIDKLYKLKLTGRELEKVAKEFKKIQDSTREEGKGGEGGEGQKKKKKKG